MKFKKNVKLDTTQIDDRRGKPLPPDVKKKLAAEKAKSAAEKAKKQAAAASRAQRDTRFLEQAAKKHKMNQRYK